MLEIKKITTMLIGAIGFILHHAPIVKHLVDWFQKYYFFRFILSILVSAAISIASCFLVIKHHPNIQTMDHVKNSAKVANARLWLENVVDRVCGEQKDCTTMARSFAYHTDKNSGTWCMGHRNMFLNKDYLGRKEIYIDSSCKKFLENNNEFSVDYDLIKNKCHDLATECLFYDTKFKNNHRAFIMCKRDNNIKNGVSCVALVNGHNLDKYLSALEQFKLNPDLSFFGD
jgi:mannitol-specific phosphotransferase system IIBC component